MSRTLEHLERLVAFASITDQGNTGIADYVEATLAAAGAQVHRIFDESGEKSGIFAATGGAAQGHEGGVMLSGHMDVVAVEGQAWSSDPFCLRREGGRVYGRGTTDMKGFLAAMLSAGEAAAEARTPLKLAFSWDEEIGCRGIPVMLEQIDATIGTPEVCIVGEPTQMQIALGHKAKRVARVTCRGEAGHSADAPDFVNALHLGAAMIGEMRAEQARLAREGAREAGYSTPYSTVHAGLMRGGRALNIVPQEAEILFELRTIAADDPAVIIKSLRERAAAIAGQFGVPAQIMLEETGGYPGLNAPGDGPAARLVRALLPEAGTVNVSYGTEAGHFAARGISTVVCGPGSMAQGHRPDEFIEIDQLAQCDGMLERLLARAN